MESDSDTLLHKGPCASCGSSDACAAYGDGHTKCYSCGAWTPGGGDTSPQRRQRVSGDLLAYEPVALTKRGLSEETLRKFRYGVADYRGDKVQVATYCDQQGTPVAQKVRTAAKDFTIVGDAKGMGLFGQHLWRGEGRRIVVTEGELDCLSVAEATGRTWDVVSLPNGAQSARKALSKALEWLLGYETIVLAFDADEAGWEAVEACVDLFPPGRCAVASYEGYKDSSELLLAENGVKRLSTAMWNAKPYRPDGIVSLADIMDRVAASPKIGFPYPWKGVTDATYGRRLGEVIGLGAGFGCGKTDLFTSMIAHDVCKLGLTTGVVYLEQSVDETGKRIAGKIAGRRFHVPGEGTPSEIRGALSQIPDGKLHLYDNWGALDWQTVKTKIRFMVTSLGVQSVYLDHLTALAAAEDDERKGLEKIMADAATMAQSLKFILHFVSHLATPEGKPHEEGGRVMGRHFKGSRAIGYWSHFMFGLERDTQKPDTPTTLRCLKDRFTGAANGRLWGLQYDGRTGLLAECELGDNEFTDQSRHDVDF